VTWMPAQQAPPRPSAVPAAAPEALEAALAAPLAAPLEGPLEGPLGTPLEGPLGAPLGAHGEAPPGAAGAAAATAALHGRRVLLVCTDYAPQRSGTAGYATAIAEHLATSAESVTVLTAVPRRADGGTPTAYRRGLRTVEPGWLSPEHPRVVRLRRYVPRRRGRGRAALHELTFLANAVAAGRDAPADLVVALVPGAAAAAAAARLAARWHAPLVTLVLAPATGTTGTTGTTGRPADRAHPAPRLVPALQRYALRRSTQVAVGSPAFREGLLSAGVAPERLHLLPAWSRLPSGIARDAAREQLGWEPDRFVAVHAGALDHEHDGATLVEAARVLSVEAPDAVEVVLVGEGSQRAALEQQAFAVPGVRFADPVDDDLPLVLAAADVLLVAEPSAAGPATATGQLAGYLAAGRPVVAATAADGPTAGELRRAGQADLRVDGRDAPAVAAALLGLRSDPGRRAAAGASAAAYARAHLGRDAALRRLDAIVEAALDAAAEPAVGTTHDPAPGATLDAGTPVGRDR